MAPCPSLQVLLGDAYDGQRVDMWSCGCSLYILLVGNYPFRSMADNGISHVKRMQAMFPRIMAGAYTAIPTVRPWPSTQRREVLTVRSLPACKYCCRSDHLPMPAKMHAPVNCPS